MIDPENHKIDIVEQRDWLSAHQVETGMVWTQIAPKIGIKYGTLTPFMTGKYAGDNQKIADAIYRYRQKLIAQAEIALEIPEPPKFFETPTSRRIMTMLSIAQRGRITVVAGGPGNSKTETIKHYAASVPNVWVATMKPSTAGVNTMQIKVLEALGERDAKGTPLALSTKIEQLTRNTDGLIVLDEAQHLGEKALEEARGWHDETGVGICLVGNQDVLLRLTLGNKRDAFARLASRVAQRLIFNTPMDDDAKALAAAWGVTAEPMRDFLVEVAKKPGGLRTCTMVMETATMLAVQDRAPISLGHLQDAWTHLSYRQLAA